MAANHRKSNRVKSNVKITARQFAKLLAGYFKNTMPNLKVQFDIYDPRYRTDPDAATCFEAGHETLNEAKKQAKEYGSGNVIVRTVLEQISGNSYKVISQKIEN